MYIFASLVALVDISGFFPWQDAVIAKTDAELTWRLRCCVSGGEAGRILFDGSMLFESCAV